MKGELVSYRKTQEEPFTRWTLHKNKQILVVIISKCFSCSIKCCLLKSEIQVNFKGYWLLLKKTDQKMLQWLEVLQ